MPPKSSEFIRNVIPIGTIFYHTSKIPPEGAFLLNGQIIYNCSTLYPTFYQYIRDNNNIKKITSSAYESELSSVGICGGFVVDSENGSIRLPNISNGFIEGSNGNNVGDAIGAGLPNITGSFGVNVNKGPSSSTGTALSSVSGAFYRSSQYDIEYFSSAGTRTDSGSYALFDASRSSSVYGSSNTVQPKSVCYSVCIQVFNTTTSLSNQAAAQLTTELQSKVGINAENFTAFGKDRIIDNTFELDSSNTTTVLATNTYYKANKAGILYATFTNNSSNNVDCYINAYLNSSAYSYFNGGYLAPNCIGRHSLLVPKNGYYRIIAGSSGASVTWSAIFIPFKNSISNS